MMVIFFQAARIALVGFDPLLSSRTLAEQIRQRSAGQIIVDHHYYTFSSIAFYTQQPELLLNGRWNNFEYGSNAPNAPDVFITDEELKSKWQDRERDRLGSKAEELSLFEQRLLGQGQVHVIKLAEGNPRQQPNVIGYLLTLAGVERQQHLEGLAVTPSI